MKKKQKRIKKKKLPIHHRIHRHVKKHLGRLKKKHPHVHKTVMMMSITLPVVLGTLLFGSGALYLYENYQDEILNNQKEKISVALPNVPDDTSAWKMYQDSLTGFSVKYLDHWNDPQVIDPSGGANYLREVVFENGVGKDSDQYKRFEVYIYDSNKYSGPVGTDNLTPKDPTNFKTRSCDRAEFGGASVGDGDYPAQEVEVTSSNHCFNEAYFFSVTRGKYTYNIVPVVGDVNSPVGEGKKSDIIAYFPKFFEILSTFVIPAEPQGVQEEQKTITQNLVQNKALPHRVLIPLGHCPNKHDHPRMSKTKHYRHMDEDCCMDPDEWPNPRCQY